MERILNIVNDNDEIIGEKTREEIHKEGWLHREVHVYFVTPALEIIFQHRAKDKDIFPDLLDATVGGHVEIGQSYEETALKEAEEETGLKIDLADLILVKKIKKRALDKSTGKINNAFNARYLYIYRGNLSDLKVEAGRAIGFEAWLLDKLATLSADDKAKFIPSILEFSTTELVEFIKKINLG